MKNFIFLCIATCIFIFSVIALNCVPSINGLAVKGQYDIWGELKSSSSFEVGDVPCRMYSDYYNNLKDSTSFSTQEEKEKYLDQLKDGKNDCLRKKAYISLEYSAFNIDLIFSFVWAILGLLLFPGNNIGKIVV